MDNIRNDNAYNTHNARCYSFTARIAYGRETCTSFPNFAFTLVLSRCERPRTTAPLCQITYTPDTKRTASDRSIHVEISHFRAIKNQFRSDQTISLCNSGAYLFLRCVDPAKYETSYHKNVDLNTCGVYA